MLFMGNGKEVRRRSFHRSSKPQKNLVCLPHTHATVPFLGVHLISTFLSSILFEDVVRRSRVNGKSLGMGQLELRYNLATKVMRNGVEVIVATDRNARPVEPEYLRHLSSTVTRPITLAPHTLTNLMSMVLPTDQVVDGQNHLISFLQPTFITRTYYTAYNYPTTFVKDNATSITNAETTIANIKTEQVPNVKSTENNIQPASTATIAESISLKASPTLQTEVFQTAYTYLNTFMDGDQPFVVSSTNTISNTVIGTMDTFSDLEPSEVFPTTNTYLKTIEFTKTLTDGVDFQIISTKDVVTQVVITDRPGKKVATKIPITTDVTKTYFVTYTYFSTYIDGDETKVKSDVSVSSDVTIEKFYIKPKATETKNFEKIRKTESPIIMSHTMFPFNIIATKTYFTTFTYFTTLLQGSNDDGAETKINSRTKVVGNTVTETISPADLNSDYMIQLNSSLQRISGSVVATATLKQGDPIVITAYKGSSVGHSYEKYAITPTKTTFDLETKLELNQIIEEEKETSKIKATSSKSIVILPKTKSSFTQKQKFKPTKTTVDEVTAEALVATEEENLVSVTPTVTLTPATPSLSNHRTEANSFTYSADVTPSSSSTVQETTVSSEDKDYPVEDETEELSVDSVTEPPKKKQTLKQPSNPVNVSSLLNLNSLGINGMNVLGPVFNAMAEIIHNNLNKNADVLSRRNDTVSPSKETEQIVKKPTSTNINPLLNFVNKFTSSTPKGTSEPKVKVTTPRTPVYIPVGSFAQDSDYGESQDSHLVIANRPEIWHEKWKDSNGKNFEKVRPHDNPITILEGGIPISPGQVITTNSDVIIGRPGESGPRPPTFAVKNNVPVDMKPPPMPPVLSDLEEEDEFIGQHSTNQGADFDLSTEDLNIIPPHSPLSPPKKHLHEFPGPKLPRPRPIDRHRGSPHHKNPHFGKHTQAEYDSGTMDLNPPPVPPPPIRTHEVHRPITINHEQDHEPVPYKSSQNVLPIPVHLNSNKNIESYINPSGPSAAAVVGVPGVAVLNQIYHENIPPLVGEPTPGIDVVNPNGILVIPTVTHIPLNLVETSNPNLVDRSTGHQLLVNIQPSQVANIVIPHGSSTALIVSGGKQHSLKGEVIDDPSPHPEPETVGFVGAEPVLKIESDDIATSLHNEVVSQTIGTDGTKSSSQDNRNLFSNRPQLTTELIKIRPKPIFGEVSVPDQHSTSEQHSEHLFFGQNLAFNRQPLPIPQSTVQVYHKGTSSLVGSHHQGEGELHLNHNHRYEGQNGLRGSGGIYPSTTHKNQNSAKGIPGKTYVNQNYRKESQNINSPGPNYFSNHKGGPTSQKIPADAFFGQNHHGDHGYGIGTNGPYLDQSVFNQGHNFVKGGNGIYVDISPPGHLPPRPDVSHVHESHSSTKHQTSINENLSSHQSGVVHDVPLNAQVQLGSGKKKENPLKEILISSNTNKHDSISFESNEKPLDPKFSESQNHVKRPVLELPDNLSPPPLPKEGSTYRPQRPPFIPNHPHHTATSTIQRYPPHPAIPEPADFMIPPPQVANRPNHKPHLDSRPVIPIGAGAPQQNYPNPRPEDIVIIPHKNRPGAAVSNHVHNIKQEVQKPLDSNLYSDLDVSDTRDPIKTEYGEEIQESISRPLFPGQLPSELQKYNTTQKVQSSNHKDGDTLKFRPNPEASQGTKIKGSSQKAETTGQAAKAKPVTGSIWNTPSNQHQSEISSNVSNYRPSNHNYNQKQETNSEEQNKTSSGLSFGPGQGDLIFGSIKKPSGFVTSNKGDSPSSGNHKDVSSFVNHRETPNLSNHREETSSFDSVKLPPANRGTTKFNLKKPGSSAALPDFVLSNNENSNIRIHAVGPNKLPSGFVKNEDAVSNKAPSENASKDKLSVDYSTHFTTNNKGASGFVTANNKESSGVSEKTPESSTSNKASNATITKDKPYGSSHSISATSHNVDVIYSGHNKLPSRYGSTGSSQAHKTSSSNSPQKFNVQGSGGQVGRPSKNPEPTDITSTIHFDSNKVSFGYPTVTNVDIHDIGSNSPPKYSGTDKITGSVKRPSGFTTSKKEEPIKLSSGSSAGDKIPPLVTATKKSPPKRPMVSHDVIPSGSVKVPSGFASKNQTSVPIGIKPNHNYENKTINFYGTETVDLYDSHQEHEPAYSNLENEADKWFASNFPAHGGNTKPNKLSPHTGQRNVSSTSNTVLTNPGDVRITLLNPPKVTEVKTKPEEVMGLSPPPLERPRRPQRPQRPKPPYKFEIPSTPKPTLTPIAIENDFPPVRSPEMNRKPLKPQDIFPPRLPDNFVHHIPEYPVRGPPKPRPPERPVTSLPIDIPGSSTTENSSNVYPIDEEENDGSDPFFAGSEINGHSKPIFNNGPVIGSARPPPTLTPTSRPKPVTHQKPSNVYQQPSKIRPSERPKVEETLPETKHKTIVTTKRQEISPTSTQGGVGKTTYHTKVSASVTPTETYPYKEWHGEDIITGSETIFDVDLFSNRVTPTITGTTSKKKIVTSFISSGSTTIFGNLFTAQQTPDSNSDFVGSLDVNESSDVTQDGVRIEKTSVTPTQTIAPVRTTTLTVTTTMTTVVHSIGHKPSTKTIVLTKTLISTVFNKVTETKTLVKPTTATIIQTHTIATTKTALVVPTALYPTHTKYPTGGTMKPEIFMADPHAKDTMTISVSSSMNKNTEDKRKQGTGHSDNDSIMVVMSNKHPNINLSVNDDSNVVSNDDSEINDSRVMVGGVFDANDEKEYKEVNREIECSPSCKAKRNELCQRIEGVMKCVCRPGFARMFPDRPCRPTYTYKVKLMLEKLGSEQISYEKNFAQMNSPNMAKLTSATKEGLDRMIMQSDLRDVYHGVMVNGFQEKDKKTMVDFSVQLSENTDETKLMDIFQNTLRTSNYSLGGTELFAAREAGNLDAEDFNECLNPKFHDCSEHARCFNLKGTYTCSCKEGYTDLSENSLFPGRVCSDLIGCEYCGYHGACYSKGEGQVTCECFQWYSGERCQINLKVLLIALVTIGAILLALLLVCAVLTCLNRRSRSSTTSRTNGSSAGYLRYRGPSSQSMDRRAMIGDSSSESSVENLPYITPPALPASRAMGPQKKPALRHAKGPAPRPIPPPGMEQRDRSVTVMIPRAKYRPMPPLSPHLTMSTFAPDKHLHKTAAQIATEQKLISYLDGNTREERTLGSTNRTENNRTAKEQQQKNYDYKSPAGNTNESPRLVEKKKESKVFEYEYKISNMLFTEETNSADRRSAKSTDNDKFRRHSDSTHMNTDNSHLKNQFRKYSAGALVSAGYEVSAKVGMHHIEDDTTEDEHSGILNTHTMKSSRSQFTTLNRTGDHKTMSEARSYDETTIHPPTRSLKTHYSGSSPSSRVNNDEGHTMIERDLGSTFILPESQLFKPDGDRGSDISNFDSL